MTRALLPIAGAAVVALVAVGLVLALRPPVATTSQEAGRLLAAELRCPDCQGLSVADSRTPAANQIRRQIDELLAAGASADEVRGHFVDRYGEWILLAPRTSWPWLVPLVGIAAGLAVLGLWLRPRRGGVEPEPAASDADLRRVRDEAEALDA